MEGTSLKIYDEEGPWISRNGQKGKPKEGCPREFIIINAKQCLLYFGLHPGTGLSRGVLNLWVSIASLTIGVHPVFDMSLTIKFWGVRGSLPSAPSPTDWVNRMEGVLRNFFAQGYRNSLQITQFMENFEVPQLGGYGAATTSVQVSSKKAEIIIDGGSGIRKISDKILMDSRGSVKGPIHIFMTHFHWDHIIGLPFFVPHFIPDCEIHYYAVQPELEKIIRSVFCRPYFPVPFEALRSKIHFHVLEPRMPCVIEDMVITPYQLDHPDPCWGFKVECNGKAYAHCVDTEATRTSREALGEDLPLYQNLDLMYFDAQYTLPELDEKTNWGHSAAEVGLNIALREKARRILFAHHDPGARSEHLLEIKRQMEIYYAQKYKDAKEKKEEFSKISWDFAYEGLTVEI